MIWDAAIAAGATVDDLEKLDRGDYPKEFIAKLIAWRRASVAIDNHTQVAISDAAERKSKSRR